MLHASWEICTSACFQHLGGTCIFTWGFCWCGNCQCELMPLLAFVEIQFARPPAIFSGSLWQITNRWFTVFACSFVFQSPHDQLCPWGIGGMDERESLVHPHAPKDSFAIWWRTTWTRVEGKNGRMMKNGAKSGVVYPLVVKHGFRITFE